MIRYLFAPVVLGLSLVGCAEPIAHRSCVAPKGVTLTEFVSADGPSLEWTEDLVGADGTTTLFICDGSRPRAIRISRLEAGSSRDSQAGLTTDGERRVVHESDLVTTSTEPVKLGEFNLTGQCLDFWSGACDEAMKPVVAPAAATATTPVAPITDGDVTVTPAAPSTTGS